MAKPKKSVSDAPSTSTSSVLANPEHEPHIVRQFLQRTVVLMDDGALIPFRSPHKTDPQKPHDFTVPSRRRALRYVHEKLMHANKANHKNPNRKNKRKSIRLCPPLQLSKLGYFALTMRHSFSNRSPQESSGVQHVLRTSHRRSVPEI